MSDETQSRSGEAPAQFTQSSILDDYQVAYRSRQVSLLGRKEVLTGKAKFGIFGDGKEVAQVAMARAFRRGDFRAGYYRDQTLMMALGVLTVEQLFAQLYADADADREPSSAGRQMNAHFATRLLDGEGAWLAHVDRYNSAADLSPTAAQMPKLVGLAYASRLYRELPGLEALAGFSRNGDEIAFGTIGNASCAEGLFWEAVNAAGVLKAPLLLSVWDDGFGISVPNEKQVTKGDISALLRGFQRSPGAREGMDIYTVKGWDYPGLCETYLNAAAIVRAEHVPAFVHVQEMTQPQGHSTSGSHERYKSEQRLEWEREFDCLRQMRRWMERQGIASSEELDAVEEEERGFVRECQRRAWEEYRAALEEERRLFLAALSRLASVSVDSADLQRIHRRVEGAPQFPRRLLLRACADALLLTREEDTSQRSDLLEWRDRQLERGRTLYGSHLHSESGGSALASATPNTVSRPPTSTATRCSTPASTACWLGTRTWWLLVKTSAGWETSIRGCRGCRRSTGSCGYPTRGFGKRRSSVRRSAWRYEVFVRSARSSTWTTCCTRCRRFRTISRRSAGGRQAARKLRLSSVRAATGWKASGIQDRPWPGSSIWFVGSMSACLAT